MTKKEYLESIGYVSVYRWDEKIPEYLWKYYKGLDGTQDARMCINLAKNKYFVGLTTAGIIENQRQIDDLQIAFNNVKRDFEEMKKYD